jgi:hypothetical protein
MISSFFGRNRKAAWKKYKGFVEAAIENPLKYPKEDIIGQAILGSREFTKKVIKGIKSGRKSDEITAKRRYEGSIDLEEMRDTICRYYKVKEIRNIDISEERRGRQMFIFLTKKDTSAFNREIAEMAEMAGGLSPSAVTHQYKRILKRLREDSKFSKGWEKESKSIMSMIKGRPH